jgi:hypothetical protein
MTLRCARLAGLLCVAAFAAACSSPTPAPTNLVPPSPRTIPLARFSIAAKPAADAVTPAGYTEAIVAIDGRPNENPTQSIELWTATLPFDEFVGGPGACTNGITTWKAPLRIRNYYPEMLTRVHVEFDSVSDPVNHYLCAPDVALPSSDGTGIILGTEVVLYKDLAGGPVTIAGSPVNDGSLPGGYADQEWAFANWDALPFHVTGTVWVELVPPAPEPPSPLSGEYLDVARWSVVDPQGDGIDVEFSHVELCPLRDCTPATTLVADVPRTGNDGTVTTFELDPMAQWPGAYQYGVEYVWTAWNGWHVGGSAVTGSGTMAGVTTFVSAPPPSNLVPAGTQAAPATTTLLSWETSGAIDPVSGFAYTQASLLDLCVQPDCSGPYDVGPLAQFPAGTDPRTYAVDAVTQFDFGKVPPPGTVVGWRVRNYYNTGLEGTPTPWRYFRMP